MFFDKFLKRSRGSITVMVTLLMVPTVFFTGFLVDLSRIKLCGDQAVMTADNYGEAVLTEYDRLLKELYGLFAITQDEKGLNALKDLQNYMTTSYHPAERMISWNHLGNTVSPLKTDYTGFMPYNSANVALSHEFQPSSCLSNTEIMSTQIGDFMRFRIIQELAGSEDMMLDALDQVQNTEGNAKIINQKDKVDDAAGKALEKMRDYYEILKRLQHYPDYIKNINKEYQAAKKEFQTIVSSSHYKIYKDYIDNIDEIREALDKEEEDRDEEDEKYIEMYEAYQGDPQARESALNPQFDTAIQAYEKSREDSIVDFESFDSLADELCSRAVAVKNAIDTLREQRKVLEEEMNKETASEKLVGGIREELQEVDRLTKGDFSGENYIRLAEHIRGNTDVNSAYEQSMMQAYYQLQVVRDDYMTADKTSVSAYKPELHLNDYKDFEAQPSYKTLYISLKDTFDSGSGEEEQAKSKKKEAEDRKKEAQKEMEEEESTTARDIPSSAAFAGIGDERTGGGFSVSDLVQTASDYFSCNSMGEAGDKFLLKFYTVAYDFGMFTSRTTNVKDSSETGQEAEKTAVSLTGVEMSRSVNYLYQAELEYLFGGHKSSQANLNAAKNHILAFRTVVNFTATYSIDEINKPIREITKACAHINPVLGIAAAAALRAGVTAVETAMDWSELKKGNSVVLIKTELEDLNATEAIDALLSVNTGSSQKKEKKFSLDYDQYLMVMLTFLTTSDQVAKRTADLITLNVNTVKNKIGEDGQLSDKDITFRMDHAYTAVDATCAVHLDFVVMPDGFAQKTLDEDIYGEVAEYEKNTYKFTVTRGY